ncbi:MAG: beta-ketoacyl-ACP synthase II [Thermodesulfobacteriota bacterium]
MAQRVLITGMGMVTCLGGGVAANWQAIEAGRSGIGPITLFDCSHHLTKIAGEVRGKFDPNGHVSEKELRRMDRYQQFTMVAASEAVADAGLECPPADPYRYGVVLGSGMGGLITVQDGTDVMRAKGPRALHPLLIPKAVINLGPGMIAMKYGFKGPNFGVVNACTSGTTAIGEAFRLVREGRVDAVVAGGAEAVICALSIGAFNALRALSKKNHDPEKASRPFDADRDGFVISEGAGLMVLESEEHAERRSARVHGEIVGYGCSSDAYHYVMPDPAGEGAYRSMKAALDDSGVSPDQIDYINAHGTSTDLNDKMETLAIKRLFQGHAHKLAISSTKSMTGHLIGAAGAVEAIYCVEAMKRGIVPPTINLEKPDPECDLDYTPNKAVSREIRYALSNSFAFGGQNGSLVFKRI